MMRTLQAYQKHANKSLMIYQRKKDYFDQIEALPYAEYLSES